MLAFMSRYAAGALNEADASAVTRTETERAPAEGKRPMNRDASMPPKAR